MCLKSEWNNRGHGTLSRCQEISAIKLTMVFNYYIFMAIHTGMAEGDGNQR